MSSQCPVQFPGQGLLDLRQRLQPERHRKPSLLSEFILPEQQVPDVKQGARQISVLQPQPGRLPKAWIPACAGMTEVLQTSENAARYPRSSRPWK